MNNLLISRIEVADIKDVTAILNEATDFKIGRGDYSWSEGGWAEDEIAGLMASRDIYKIKNAGQIVGTFSLTNTDVQVWGERPNDAAYLHSLAVGSRFHGLSLGNIAVGWAVANTFNARRPYLRLDCAEDNSDLRCYYEALGFTHVATKIIKEWDNYSAAMYQRPTSLFEPVH